MEEDVRVFIEPIDRAFPSRREREIAAVGRIVARVFGADTQLCHNDAGAPFIAGVEISVSHSTAYAAVAIGAPGRKIGLDIEGLNRAPQLRRVASRILSEEEIEEYGGSDSSLVEAWTLKEALVKCSGWLDADFRRDIALPRSSRGEKKATITCRRSDGTTASVGSYDIIFSGVPGDSPGQWLALVAESR